MGRSKSDITGCAQALGLLPRRAVTPIGAVSYIVHEYMYEWLPRTFFSVQEQLKCLTVVAAFNGANVNHH